MTSRLKPALAALLLAWLGWSAQALASDCLASDPVVIFTAASTAPAIEEISERLGLNWVIVPASSGTLARQIDAGARADLFISANPDWMDFLAKRNRLPLGQTEILRNRLVLAAPALSKWTCTLPCGKLVEHMDSRPFAICDPAHAPCGQYAEQALKHIGLWDRVSNRMIRGASAQLTLNWIALGEAGAGIVYASDAHSNSNIRTLLALPEESHDPIRYLMARLSDGAAAVEAEQALMSDMGKEVFRNFGFILPPPEGADE